MPYDDHCYEDPDHDAFLATDAKRRGEAAFEKILAALVQIASTTHAQMLRTFPNPPEALLTEWRAFTAEAIVENAADLIKAEIKHHSGEEPTEAMWEELTSSVEEALT